MVHGAWVLRTREVLLNQRVGVQGALMLALHLSACCCLID
jgi:hypothetical protein